MSTNFPNGLLSKGVPVDSQRTLGWWGTTYFVDYDLGNDGNNGKTPTAAFKNFQAALDVIEEDDVIYMKPRAGNPDSGHMITPTSADNWTIGTAAGSAGRGLSVIGASNVSGLGTFGGRYRVYMRGYGSGVTASNVLKINVPFVSIENIAWHQGSISASVSPIGSTGIILLQGQGSPGSGWTSIYNCNFKIATIGCVRIVDSWYDTVEKCTFDRCIGGVNAHGATSALIGTRVIDCDFMGTAANNGQDISIYSDSANDRDILIKGCIFNHPVGTYAGTLGYYVYTHGTCGCLITDCRAGDDNMEAATDYVIATGTKMTQNFDNSDNEWGTT